MEVRNEIGSADLAGIARVQPLIPIAGERTPFRAAHGIVMILIRRLDELRRQNGYRKMRRAATAVCRRLSRQAIGVIRIRRGMNRGNTLAAPYELQKCGAPLCSYRGIFIIKEATGGAVQKDRIVLLQVTRVDIA